MSETLTADAHIAHVRSTLPVAKECPRCGMEGVRNGTRIARMRDIPMHGRPAYVDFVRQRLVCRACGNTWQAAHPALDATRDMTARFVKWLEARAADTDFAQISDEAGVDRKSIQRVAADAAARVLPLPDRLSDRIAIEMFLVAGRWRPVVLDIVAGAVHDVLKSADEVPPAISEMVDLLRRRPDPVLVVDARLALVKDAAAPPSIALPSIQHMVSLTSLQREVSDLIEEAMRVPLIRETGRSSPESRLFRLSRQELRSTGIKRPLSHLPPRIARAYLAKEAFRGIANRPGDKRESAVRSWFQTVLGPRGQANLPLVARRIRTIWPAAFAPDGRPLFRLYPDPIAYDGAHSSESFAAVRAALIERDGGKFRSGN